MGTSDRDRRSPFFFAWEANMADDKYIVLRAESPMVPVARGKAKAFALEKPVICHPRHGRRAQARPGCVLAGIFGFVADYIDCVAMTLALLEKRLYAVDKLSFDHPGTVDLSLHPLPCGLPIG